MLKFIFNRLQRKKDDLVILSWELWGLEKLWNPDNMHHWSEASCLLGDGFQQKYVRPNILPPILPPCLAQCYSKGACWVFLNFVCMKKCVSEWINEWMMQQSRKWGVFKFKSGYFHSQHLLPMTHYGIGEHALKLYVCWEDFSLHRKGLFHEMKTSSVLLTIVF